MNVAAPMGTVKPIDVEFTVEAPAVFALPHKVWSLTVFVSERLRKELQRYILSTQQRAGDWAFFLHTTKATTRFYCQHIGKPRALAVQERGHCVRQQSQWSQNICHQFGKPRHWHSRAHALDGAQKYQQHCCVH